MYILSYIPRPKNNTACGDSIENEMNSMLLRPDSALYGYTGPGTIQANEINSSKNHAPGAGLFTCSVDLQSRVPL